MEKEDIMRTFKHLQEDICAKVSALDEQVKLVEDRWERPGGGGGFSRSLAEGAVIEKGCINFSAVYGEAPERLKHFANLHAKTFYATGLSIVLHPKNPYVPIIHMNVRYFELDSGASWFGGGIDLTPHYINCKESVAFHQDLEAICALHPTVADYPHFKRWADDYFYLPHRQETRGIGGIFFDQLQTDSTSARLAFVEALGLRFPSLYEPLVEQNRSKSYGPQQEHWQRLRRGRYVEFNLVYDAGTQFGLQSGGRTESILMSLPPQANWRYNYSPSPGSPEAETVSLLRKGIDWLNLST